MIFQSHEITVKVYPKLILKDLKIGKSPFNGNLDYAVLMFQGDVYK